jgi:hypothetical protein
MQTDHRAEPAILEAGIASDALVAAQTADEEGASGQSEEPEGERGGGERNRPDACLERSSRDAGEEDAEHEEERAQGAALRRGSHRG